MISAVSEFYPWLEAPWQSLKSHIDSDRVPHALLMQGPTGVGKSALAALFARRLLCTEPDERPCGHCHSCHLFEAGTHPDYQCVGPEEPGKAIKVDVIRKLINDLSLKPQYGGYRVFVIDQAEQMNLSSANALLKTLEEPAERTVLLLITHRASRLLPTILSRCQKLSIRAPRKEAAIQWLLRQHPGCAAEVLLSASGGSPLQALALMETDVVERRQRVFQEFGGLSRRQLDPVGIAERWHGQSHEECLNWMLSWVADMIYLLMAPAASRLSNTDLEVELTQLAKSLRIRSLIGFRDELLNFRQALGGQVNRQLLLEEALIGWSRLPVTQHESMSEEQQPDRQQGMLSLSIRDAAILYAYFMPFIKNGGLFIPTHRAHRLGDEVFVLLHLMDEPERIPVVGKVVLITPKQSENQRPQGIGIQFDDKEGPALRVRIETYLFDFKDSQQPTHTF